MPSFSRVSARAIAALLLLAVGSAPAVARAQQGAGAPRVLPPGLERPPTAQERQLVELGGLLLPPLRLELAPELGYAHDQGTTLAPSGGGLALVEQDSDRGTAALIARLGLPMRLQAEVRVPFAWLRQTLTGLPGSERQEASGLGDVRTALSWNPVAGQAFPDVLLTGFWQARTGASLLDTDPAEVALGEGIERFGGTVALVQALAPVALRVAGTGAHGVSRWTSAGWLEPGWTVGGALGASVAATPALAFSLGVDAAWSPDVRLEHATVADTARTAVWLRAGVGALASSRADLQLDVAVGLTEDVRGLQVVVSAPLLF
ncbi:MAG: hypothetical protein QM767_18245 [Anaeromyxobacter sp.]